MKNVLLCFALVGLGLVVGTFVPSVSAPVRQLAGILLPPPPASNHGHGHSHGHGDGHEDDEAPEGHVVLTAEQIESAKIAVEEVSAGTLTRKISVPGTVTTDADRVARIAGRVVGTVAEMRKRLGETVTRGEVVAVLDSREVAEARSEFFAARTNLELQQTLFEREQALWDKRISAEQQYLRARQTFTEAQLRIELASQKLQALGFSEADVAELARRFGPVQTVSAAPDAPLRRTVSRLSGLQKYEIRSPITGRVIERRVDLGAPIGGESEEKELYVVADLSSVWIDLSVPSGDLALIREGQEVAISAGNGSEPSHGKIVFVSPILNQETRSARVIAAVDNKDMAWRPGSYVTAQVLVSEEPVDMKVPRSALQAIGGEQVVFVRNEKGFEKREVVLGKGDDVSVEIVFGLDPGEKIAAANSFVLKAELGKAEAEHVH
ncbi:efflux RND transporter periplasmic adaptor subunit [Enterovirga aerilata]|uniref:Efflux RND transporter periplasmic adaptor subunit n=1 Tax=Enterovirga aerilata TaxID=2730920 RepID=A0A849HZ95_9HYPH|nr:efflux RND transporter periplasmic adaptor subunit [Enterovirga sp. DB1703]NNM72422.1 efflux RND transporter periplasmic adaptor subunit [Enterovirga sp. DB1703]